MQFSKQYQSSSVCKSCHLVFKERKASHCHLSVVLIMLSPLSHKTTFELFYRILDTYYSSEMIFFSFFPGSHSSLFSPMILMSVMKYRKHTQRFHAKKFCTSDLLSVRLSACNQRFFLGCYALMFQQINLQLLEIHQHATYTQKHNFVSNLAMTMITHTCRNLFSPSLIPILIL